MGFNSFSNNLCPLSTQLHFPVGFTSPRGNNPNLHKETLQSWKTKVRKTRDIEIQWRCQSLSKLVFSSKAAFIDSLPIFGSIVIVKFTQVLTPQTMLQRPASHTSRFSRHGSKFCHVLDTATSDMVFRTFFHLLSVISSPLLMLSVESTIQFTEWRYRPKDVWKSTGS